jgi:hypothetical protein
MIKDGTQFQDLGADHFDGRSKAEVGQVSFQLLISLLRTIPGTSLLAAQVILSEIGPDMSRLPTAGHLLS